jgi:CRISPR-associated endonuclease Cas1
MYSGGWHDNPEGVPQGGVISPLLSNIYLHPFDAAMTGAKYRLVRYADDFLFLESNRDRAAEAIQHATQYLADELFLHTKPAEIRQVSEGFVFLGFLFQGGGKTIAPGKLEQMKRRLREGVRAGRTLGQAVRALNLMLIGWRNYYGAGDTREQFQLLETTLFNELVARLKTFPSERLRETRSTLAGLEFLLPRTQTERDRFASLLLTAAEGRDQDTAPGPELPVEPTRAVQAKRRQYERSAEEDSVLLVDRPGSFVGKTSKRVVVKERGRRAREVPLFRLRCIMVASSGVGLSSDLVRFCSGQNVTISFVDERGRPYSYLVGSEHSAHPLTLLQLEAQKSAKGQTLARAFVEGKITNQMNLLRYYAKYRGRRESEFGAGIQAAVERIRQLLEQLAALPGDEHFGGRLFAIEGQAGAAYWSLVRALLASDACFERREKQGATDIVNSLLNYGYGVLYGLMHRLIILAGLNPNVGFIHRDCSGRPSLLFDVVEEFRQPVVDRAVIKLLRKKARLGMDGTLLDQPTRRRLVAAVMDNLGSPVYYRSDRVSLRAAMEGQVKRLAGFLKDEEQYRPFIFH